MQAPYGFVLTDQTYTVTFGWNDQSNDVVLAQTIVDHPQDGDEVYSYDIINAADASDEQLTGQPGTIVFENAPCAACARNAREFGGQNRRRYPQTGCRNQPAAGRGCI